jgi:hypothetical protein
MKKPRLYGVVFSLCLNVYGGDRLFFIAFLTNSKKFKRMFRDFAELRCLL